MCLNLIFTFKMQVICKYVIFVNCAACNELDLYLQIFLFTGPNENYCKSSFRPEIVSSLIGSAPPQHTLRHRPPHELPTCENADDDMDNLDDVRLTYIL